MLQRSNLEMSRRNLLLGTATSVVLGAASRRAFAQDSPDVTARAPVLASEAPSLGQVSIRVNGILRDLAVDTSNNSS
jgi:xanthine dehydrogenase YagT iron-sulfur-binding subunit